MAIALFILRTVVNYDFSPALNIDRRIAQALNRTLLLLAFAPCSRCPWLTQNSPNLQPFEVWEPKGLVTKKLFQNYSGECRTRQKLQPVQLMLRH